MTALSERVVAVLEPYVGRMVADTCIRATALSVGKTADSLDDSDMPALMASIRRLLGPVAPAAAIEDVIAGLGGGA